MIKEIQKRNKKNKDVKKIKYCPHTWTTGLGFALALQMVGILPEEERSVLEYPLEGHWKPENWTRFIKGGFKPDKDLRIKIPDGLVLGIEIDMNVIRRFGKRIYNGTAGKIGINKLKDRGWKQTIYLKEKKAEQIERTLKAEFVGPNAPF